MTPIVPKAEAAELICAARIRCRPTRPRGIDAAPPPDPTSYRFHEEFGDGIMSAVNFKVDFARREHPDGDRVAVTFDGRFLDYRW